MSDKFKKPPYRISGGIHPPSRKKTQNMKSVMLPVPERVIIPMRQHIGAICEPTVKKGDNVCVGDLIGITSAHMSVPVHSSVSGIVEAVRPVKNTQGESMVSVIIKSDGMQTPSPSLHPVSSRNKNDMIQAVRDSGLVGLGGAGFPTYFKLIPPPGDKFEILLINGAECEPYITSDFREMVEDPEDIIKGIKLVMEMTNIPKAIIGIEDNKQEAIKKLIDAASDIAEIEVSALKTKYPQGGEKQLIYALTGKEMPSGKLPSSIGVLVLSINTVSYISTYFRTGMPLVSRRITIDGSAIKNPKNVIVPIGTPLKDLVNFCGGFSETPEKIVMGGPMMGTSIISQDNTVLKQTNAILFLSKKEIDQTEESPCIRCGRCVKACPMHLLPYIMNQLVIKGRAVEAAEKYALMDCIECGSCTYVCPASRYLVQSFRSGKAEFKHQKVRKQLTRDAEKALESKGYTSDPKAEKSKSGKEA